jgi:hypothetical protein
MQNGNPCDVNASCRQIADALTEAVLVTKIGLGAVRRCLWFTDFFNRAVLRLRGTRLVRVPAFDSAGQTAKLFRMCFVPCISTRDASLFSASGWDDPYIFDYKLVT